MFQAIEVSIFLVLLGIILIFFFIYLLKINKAINKIENSINKNQVNKKIIVKNETENNEVNDKNEYIDSPMVGIVYLTPEPTKPQFVEEDSHVKQGDTVAVIEAMKTFNNVRAPRTCIIKKILVKSGTPVEFGEKLFIIE